MRTRLLALLILFAPALVHRAAASWSAPPGWLEVTATPPVTRTGAASVRHDFGSVDPLGAPRIAASFVLRNSGDTPRTIERLQSSCGCANLALGEAGGSPPVTLAPGQETTLGVEVLVAQLHPGPLAKSVWLYEAGSARPVLTVELAGRIMAGVELTPAIVDFGRVRAAETVHRSVLVTATLDARLVAGGAWPRLVCSDPEVVVAARPEAPRKVTLEGREALRRQYTVRLPAGMHLGVLGGSLLFFPPSGSTASPPPGSLPPETLSAVLSSTAARLSGEVAGSVSASPGMLVFGAVQAGKSATRSVMLKAVSASVVARLKVASATPLLVARVVPVPGGDATSALLEVTVGAEMPPGTLQTQVVVTTAAGERLVVPVLVTAEGRSGPAPAL